MAVEIENRPVWVRIHLSARRGTETDRIYGLVLLRVRPPVSASAAGFHPRDCVTAHRMIRYGAAMDSPGPTAEAWLAFIEREGIVGAGHEASTSHLHREFDSACLRPFADPDRYRAYLAAVQAAARSGLDAIPPRDRATIEDLHQEIFAPLIGEAGQIDLRCDFEADAAEAPAPAEGAAPAAAPAPSSALPTIPFFPTGHGKPAHLLVPGDVILPERDRERRWEVEVAAAQAEDEDTVVVRCRLLGPYGLNESAETRGVFRALRSILVPLAGAPSDAAPPASRPGIPWRLAFTIGLAGAVLVLLLYGLLSLL